MSVTSNVDTRQSGQNFTSLSITNNSLRIANQSMRRRFHPLLTQDYGPNTQLDRVYQRRLLPANRITRQITSLSLITLNTNLISQISLNNTNRQKRTKRLKRRRFTSNLRTLRRRNNSNRQINTLQLTPSLSIINQFRFSLIPRHQASRFTVSLSTSQLRRNSTMILHRTLRPHLSHRTLTHNMNNRQLTINRFVQRRLSRQWCAAH